MAKIFEIDIEFGIRNTRVSKMKDGAKELYFISFFKRSAEIVMCFNLPNVINYKQANIIIDYNNVNNKPHYLFSKLLLS